MPQELTTEYDVDLREYIDRIEPIIRDRHPPAEPRAVAEVLFADDGPVDYLIWMALEGYEDHTLFYYDADPDARTLRRLLAMDPTEAEMPKLRAFLRHQYDTFEVIETARLFEIPDTYLPQFSPAPRANIGFFYSPVDDVIAAGISTTPISKQAEILEDVDKLLPDSDIEQFVTNVIRTLYNEIEADIERHVIEGDVRPQLEADPDFRQETVTALPEDIHPEYEGDDAELWQKPASKVDFLAGAQGFLQVWLPTAAEDLALVTVTSGAYDEEAVVERTREQLRDALQNYTD